MMAAAKRICEIPDCTAPTRCKGLCSVHYDRVRKTGSPYLPRRERKFCTVDGCERAAVARGMCEMHYDRVRKHGAPGPARRVKFVTSKKSSDVVGRILERTEPQGDCIVWGGYALPSGYGLIHWHGRKWVVHRAMWTAQVGPIPDDDDWTIDHLCRVKRCVNVKHMEVVTRTENSLRAGGLAIAQGRNKQNSGIKCKNGHERTSTNTGRTASGHRRCLDCARARWAKSAETIQAKRRAAYRKARDAGLSVSEAQRASIKGVEV